MFDSTLNSFIKKVLLLSAFQFFVLGFNPSLAQQDSSYGNIAVGIRFHYGFVMAHRPSIVSLQNSHLGGVDVNVVQQTTGTKAWQQHYGYPRLGVKFGYYGLGNLNQLGHAFALYPFTDFDLGRYKTFNWNIQIGWGFGYIDKAFDLDNNYKNVAIGSGANSCFNFNISGRILISKKDRLYLGVGLTHFSNASLVTPNLGVNLATAQLQYSHLIGKAVETKRQIEPLFKKSYRKALYIAGFAKQIYPAGGNYYFAGTLSANLVKHFAYKSAIGLGLDYFYDESIIKKLRNNDKKITPVISASRVGVNAVYELVVSDFSATLAMGYYCYSNLNTDGNLYHRMGVRYLIAKNLFATVNLKTHFAKADYLEVGVGWKW